mgnify:CR=1 FL=1
MNAYAASFEITNAVFSPAGLFNNLGELMSNIIQIMISIGGILCIIFIIVGGFKFVTSGGDEKKLASAKGTLTYAIVGLIVIILAFAMIQVVQYFLESTAPIVG